MRRKSRNSQKTRDTHPLHASQPHLLRRVAGGVGRPALAGVALGLLALGVTAIAGRSGGAGTDETPGVGTKPDIVLPVIDDKELAGLSDAARTVVRETEACEAVVLQSETDLDKALERMRVECHEPAAERMAEINGESTVDPVTTDAGSTTTQP